MGNTNELKRILRKISESLNQPKRPLIIHPQLYEKISRIDIDFLDDNFVVILCSCIKPTEAYVGSSDFLVECPIDSWEKA